MTIYDETLVPAYTLPDPLVDAHDVAITQAARRRLFESQRTS